MNRNFCVFNIDNRFRSKQLITFYVDEIDPYLWVWPDIIIDISTVGVGIVGVVDQCTYVCSSNARANTIYNTKIAVKI